METGKVNVQALIEPVLHQLIEKNKVLGIENDSSGVAVVKADQLVAFEVGGVHMTLLVCGSFGSARWVLATGAMSISD
jgi:hypothetical protein